MEVEFPSGFTIDSESKEDLLSSEKVKKVETKNGDTVVVLYIDNLDLIELCPTFEAFRTYKIANQKPALVTVYDYYDTSRKSSKFYEIKPASLCDICEEDDCKAKCAVLAK